MKDTIIKFPLSQTHGTWKTKQLIFFNVLVLILLWSLFTPSTKIFWDTIDIAFFKTINSTLKGNPNWQLFWAFANHKIADWVETSACSAFSSLMLFKRAKDCACAALRNCCSLCFTSL